MARRQRPLWRAAAVGSSSSETVGAITLAGGANTIDVVNNGGAVGTAQLNLASLSRSDTSATLHFIGSGGSGPYTPPGWGGPRVCFATALTLIGGILPYATVDNRLSTANQGVHWATVTNDRYLIAYVDCYAGAPATWGAAHNVSIAQDEVLASGTDTTINSLRFGGNNQVKFEDSSMTLKIVAGGRITCSSIVSLLRIQTRNSSSAAGSSLATTCSCAAAVMNR